MRDRLMKDEVKYLKVPSEPRYEFVLPFNKDMIFSSVRSLSSAIEYLDAFATAEEHEERRSAIVYVQRRLLRIFSPVFKERIYDCKLNTDVGSDIFGDILWSMDVEEKIPPRTFTIEKSEQDNTFKLGYKNGFHASSENLEIPIETSNEKCKYQVRSCGKGVKGVHAPYSKNFEGWRYNNGRVSFSIEETDDSLKVGLSSVPASPPLWYRVYSRISYSAGPYAYDTFELRNQTRVIKGQIVPDELL